MSTATVPDSIFDRSRMSLIRVSRSLPDAWMVCANCTCLPVRLPAAVLGELVRENQQAVERRAQLVRHVGEELGLEARGERQLLGFLFQRLPRLLDLGVLALHFDVLFGQQLGLLFELLVGELQLLLLELELVRQRLRLLQQIFGARVGLDGVQHDADALGELIEEGVVRRVELIEGGQLEDALHLSFKQDGQDDQMLRRGFTEAGDHLQVAPPAHGRAGSCADRSRTGRSGLRPALASRRALPASCARSRPAGAGRRPASDESST